MIYNLNTENVIKMSVRYRREFIFKIIINEEALIKRITIIC